MRIAVMILGIASISIFSGLMLLTDEYLYYGVGGLVLAAIGLLLWLIGVAFAYGVPPIAVAAFSIAAVVGAVTPFLIHFASFTTWVTVPFSIMLALLSVAGRREKEREDAYAAQTREQLSLLIAGLNLQPRSASQPAPRAQPAQASQPAPQPQPPKAAQPAPRAQPSQMQTARASQLAHRLGIQEKPLGGGWS